MATDTRIQSTLIQRYRPPRVIPLELWDLQVGDRILWDFMKHPDFAKVLVGTLANLHSGVGSTRSAGPVPSEIQGFDAVWIGGGAAQCDRFRSAMKLAHVPVYFANEPTFVGEPGGMRHLKNHDLTGWVVDLGQTKLKISDGSRRWTFARDFELLPIRDDILETATAQQRKRLREFLVHGLRTCVSETDSLPEGLILA